MGTVLDIVEKIKTFILGLNPTYVGIAAFVFLILVVVLVTAWLNSLAKSEDLKKSYSELQKQSLDMMTQGLQNSRLKMFNYEEISKFMESSGLNFMTNNKLTPLSYVTLKLLFGLFVMIVLTKTANVFAGLLGLIIIFVGVDIFVSISDASDNKSMLEDIKNIYDTLRIQTKAGVYITSVLTDCYLVTKNKRLKKALLDLTSDIIAKNDIDDALDSLKMKFRNQYIDSMVVVIKQSLKTGQATKMFEDIKAQIEDIDAALIQAEQQRVKTQITIVQVLLYTGILILALYAAMMGLRSGLNF
jgi:Flp pilus assembly protein TadB